MEGQRDGLEGKQSTMEGRNTEIFEALKGFLESAERFRGLISSCSDWYETFRPSKSVSLFDNASHTDEDAKSLEKALEVRRVLEPTRQALSAISVWTTTQNLDCKDQVASLRMRVALRSLPDEVLSLILEFASYHAPVKSGYEFEAIAQTLRAATNLALVCTRFRLLINASPCLWDRIHPNIHSDLLPLSFSRSGRSVKIHVDASPRYWFNPDDLEHFVSIIVRNSNFWRTMVIDFRGMANSVFVNTAGSESENWSERLLKTWSDSARDLDSPLLTNLVLDYPEAALLIDNVRQGKLDEFRIHFYLSWSICNLRSLKARNLIPLPFSGSGSLKSLCINLSFGARCLYPERGKLDTIALTYFLLSCSALERITIGLTDCKFTKAASPAGDRVIMLPNVSYVGLGFQSCKATVVNSLVGAIRFPNASTVEVEVVAVRLNEREVEEAYIRSIVEAVLPDAEAFPRAERMRLTIDADGPLRSDRSLSLPFSSLVTLEHLELDVKNMRLTPISDGIALPFLQSLTLTDGDACRVKDWMRKFVRRLQERACPSHLLQIEMNGERIRDFSGSHQHQASD